MANKSLRNLVSLIAQARLAMQCNVVNCTTQHMQYEQYTQYAVNYTIFQNIAHIALHRLQLDIA